jgi:hypothetical protein
MYMYMYIYIYIYTYIYIYIYIRSLMSYRKGKGHLTRNRILKSPLRGDFTQKM